MPLLERQFRVGPVAVSLGGAVAAAATLLVVWVVARAIERGFLRQAERRDAASRAAVFAVARITRYVLYAAGVLLALDLLGIPTSRFAVVAGALGVGLGFGLQAIFSNFVSGVILLFDRSLRVGDFVELGSGVQGEVRDIGIRATSIRTNDNIDVLVPNSEFVTGRVVNWTHGDLFRRIRVPFGVAYGSDRERVKKAALEAAGEVPFTLAREGQRRPQVWLVNFGESSLDFELVVWLTPEATKRPGAVRAAYLWALDGALARHRIEVPFAQRDLNVRSLFGLEGEAALALLRPRAGAPPPEPEAAAIHPAERGDLARNDALEDVAIAAREEAERQARQAVEEGAEQAGDGAGGPRSEAPER